MANAHGVNFVELLCTAGLPAMYTAILTQHDLGPSAHYAYLGLYILAYMAGDAAGKYATHRMPATPASSALRT